MLFLLHQDAIPRHTARQAARLASYGSLLPTATRGRAEPREARRALSTMSAVPPEMARRFLRLASTSRHLRGVERMTAIESDAPKFR